MSEEKTMKTNKGCVYPDLSLNVERDLTIMLGKITHFMHRDIVNYIIEKNEDYKKRFTSSMDTALQDSFFDVATDCVFPGYRRPINGEKFNKWKNNINEQDGTILNDNTLPRHIWTYLIEGKGYSGGTKGNWNRTGLDKFELAHIFGHKQDERKTEKKFFKDYDDAIIPYGLFTSASNVVLIPKGFAKPTDHMEVVKLCFYKRYIDYYNLEIPGLENLDETLIPSWYDEKIWKDPILPSSGWERKIDKLLEYREKHLMRKYKPYLELKE